MKNPSKKEMANRWRLAKEWMEKVNHAISLGYIVHLSGVDNGLFLNKPVIIDGNEIIYRFDDFTTYRLFENDPEWDHGLYETHEEWVSRKGLKIYREVPLSEFSI